MKDLKKWENVNLYLLSAVFLSVALIWLLVFVYSLHQALPYNPLKLPFEKKVNTISWFPQGWGFFTKDPRSEDDYVYDIQTKAEAVAWPNNTPENLFGISRYGRAQGIEVGLIEYEIPKSDWENYQGNMWTYFNNKSPVLTINNTTPHATICGKIGLVKKEPTVWAWSKLKNVKHPYKITVVNVKCSKN
ncbi:SdpA family antimicrobial peptide system protein [Tuberibacillus calidus]|jgi:antimicrobial peptide system SdpA family protein|uniref:SdpA family antimicrobial peptide system protein n=1 Tax=Tuberibacillus calidus TaxID=340097 RepID=UPI000483243F|nr:SdpA family antimicrobial peptide system protein [Tuberibacillus calidus]